MGLQLRVLLSTYYKPSPKHYLCINSLKPYNNTVGYILLSLIYNQNITKLVTARVTQLVSGELRVEPRCSDSYGKAMVVSLEDKDPSKYGRHP